MQSLSQREREMGEGGGGGVVSNHVNAKIVFLFFIKRRKPMRAGPSAFRPAFFGSRNSRMWTSIIDQASRCLDKPCWKENFLELTTEYWKCSPVVCKNIPYIKGNLLLIWSRKNARHKMSSAKLWTLWRHKNVHVPNISVHLYSLVHQYCKSASASFC